MNDAIELLFDTYKQFYEPTTSVAEILEQWREIKAETLEHEGLASRNFQDLWSHMLVHYTDEYLLVLILVAIALIIPVDTSECERIFSLMNDLKTAERSCIAQTNLRNLMVWHRHASDLPCEKVPVEAILEEFHKLSGARGRNAHRGQAPPQYNFTVKEEAGSSGV